MEEGSAGRSRTQPPPSMTSRRFPAPWRADNVPGGYVIRDANRQALTYVYSRDNEAEARQARYSRRTRRDGLLSTSHGCRRCRLRLRPSTVCRLRSGALHSLTSVKRLCREEANARSHAHGCCGSGVYHDRGGDIVSSIAVQLSVVPSNAQDRRRRHILLFHQLPGVYDDPVRHRQLLLLKPCLQRPWPPLSLSQSHSLAFMAQKTGPHVRANRSATTTYSKMAIVPSPPISYSVNGGTSHGLRKTVPDRRKSILYLAKRRMASRQFRATG
jgi:hypothetical protein